MKIIFLDIDGVLWTGNHARHVTNHAPNANERMDEFCPDAVARFNEILEECPDVRIVISSAWRVLHEYDWLKDHFDLQGIDPDRIIGVTPDLPLEIRGKEIQKWLDDNEDVDDFIILDDDEDMGNLTDKHLYRTGFYTGLTDEITEEIKRRFCGKTS